MGLRDKPRFLRHEDDKGCDEVSICTIPRYKTSGLSGDEWRVSALLQFKRKGEVIAERSFRDVETALAFAPGLLIETLEDASVVIKEQHELCFQPGCAEPATTEYRLKHRYNADGRIIERYDGRDLRRRFCARHSRRGDCGLEDADRNYELVSGHPAMPVQSADESPSVFGGVIDLRHVEEDR